MNMFGTMLNYLGPSNWWPGETPFEIALGAILTQNTNWNNTEKAIWNLRREGLLDAKSLYSLPQERLGQLIRPAGYFRIKADRLKNFLSFLSRECTFDMQQLAEQEMEILRPKLLQVKGIGPETADSILLYALNKPSFVVDAYTHRIFNRHLLVPEDVDYSSLRNFFMDSLSPDVELFNEYHALLVRVGKSWCRKKSGLCEACPLSAYLE